LQLGRFLVFDGCIDEVTIHKRSGIFRAKYGTQAAIQKREEC
jgi:hypothetical protein